MRPFRFGVQVARAASGAEWLDLARRMETMGYGTLSMPDHADGDLFASFPALAAASVVTSRIRLGQLVLANDFRNPLLVAREALTLDLLSDGRVELGLGAGGNERDHESLGIPLEPPAVRIERLAESVRILKRLFTEEEVTFEGRYYRLRRARAVPRPRQVPRPPILVAGGGPRLLALAASEADIVGLFPARLFTKATRFDFSWTSADLQAKRIAEHAGDRSIEINVLITDTVVTGDRAGAVAELARRYQQDDGTIATSPYVLVGTLGEIRQQLVRIREGLGISYFSLRGPSVETVAPLVRELTGS